MNLVRLGQGAGHGQGKLSAFILSSRWCHAYRVLIVWFSMWPQGLQLLKLVTTHDTTSWWFLCYAVLLGPNYNCLIPFGNTMVHF